ncbi:uncharacterized protein [Venturia canescens]|uniref:uncharacterized protein n=1 Tax=Venturia canescens TaxID=32260 RepID=UPI001C9D33A9|nr:uncharacterized protein LOC122411600 [Venturia canescens]
MQTCDEDIVAASEQLAAVKSMAELNRLQKEVQTTRKNYRDEISKKVQAHREELRNTFELLVNKNEKFLQEIQSFKDGGNFSVDEVKSYKKTLTSLGKTILNLQSANLERLNRVIGELDAALETLVKSALENFNTKLKELTFVENLKKEMTKCAVIIERQVDRLLEDDTIFIDAVLNSVEKSPTSLCETSTVQMTEILDLMESRTDHLLLPFPMPKNIVSQEPVKWSRKRSVANKKRKEKILSKATNYVSLFIGSEDSTARGSGFSVTTMNTMVKTLEKIQADATKYFSGSPKRNETETTYHDHMKKILEKMNGFRVQLENLWRQEVRGNELLIIITIDSSSKVFEKKCKFHQIW